MENGGYLLAAFAVVWALIFAYIIAVFNRQKKLRRDLELLRETGKEKGLEE